MISHARARYMLAMGLLPPMAPLVSACRNTATPETTPVVIEDASSARTKTVDPAPPPEPKKNSPKLIMTDAGAGFWDVKEEAVAEPTPSSSTPPGQLRVAPPHRMPSCPSGNFCSVAPATVRNAAEAPYASCDTQVSYPRKDSRRVTFDPALTKRQRETVANACCYSWFILCPGGRPLRSDGEMVLAAPTPRADWSALGASFSSSSIDHETRAALAAHWLREAAAEHASVASFSRFSLQLLALGAAPALVSAAHEAALDEIRHAAHCYALASRYSDAPVGPGTLSIPSAAIAFDPAAVALETLRDGCLGESLAARVAAEAAAVALDPEVANVLASIARDEEKHAELAWKTVAWLVTNHGDPVRAVVTAFIASLAENPAEEMPVERAPTSSRRSLTEHGVLDTEQHLAVQRETVREIVLPCLRALVPAMQ